jgi:hypothetical protein
MITPRPWSSSGTRAHPSGAVISGDSLPSGVRFGTGDASRSSALPALQQPGAWRRMHDPRCSPEGRGHREMG